MFTRELTSVLTLISLFNVALGDYRDVSTDQGVVRGYNVDADDVYSFYSIPYATAPTGEDRFKDALPPPTWDDVFNATDYRIACTQIPTYNYEINVTMDCLKLHVFVPDTQETNLPVLFFIHGGAHQAGVPAMYSPVNLVKRGMIVVNFSYRVGALGFLCLNNEFAPGNAGLKDQLSALKWVKRNIASFGGDPDNITVGGSSSGSFCVELQILSPRSNGLFNKASSIGGSTISEQSFTREPLAIAEEYATMFGVKTGQDVSRLESFYRSLSDEQLGIRFRQNPKQMGFTPCIETHNVAGVEKFITEYPIDILVSGNYEKVPHISGITPMDGLDMLHSFDDYSQMMERDFRYFIPDSVQFDSEEHAEATTQRVKDFYFPTGEITMLEFVYYFTDYVFTFPQIASARLQAKNGAPVYLYMLSYNGTIHQPGAYSLPITGSGHVTPQLYLQDNLDSFIYDNMREEEYIIREKLSDLFYHFVKDGIPRSDLVNETWMPVTAENADFLHMYDELDFLMEVFPLGERTELWNNIYNYPFTSDAGATSYLSSSAVICCFILALFNLFL